MEFDAYKKWIGGVFDRSAETYGTMHSDFFNYFAKNLVQFADIPQGARVLDVATGRGAVLKHIANAIGTDGTVVGVDISPSMIEKTKRDFKDVELICCDAENLPFQDRSFDFVFCGFAVFFFPDISRALNEFKRVLKDNGELIISTWGKDDEIDSIFHTEYVKYATPEKALLHNFENPNYIREILTANGFSNVATVSDKLEYVYPSIEAWFNAIWSHAGRAKLEKLTPENYNSLKHALNNALSSRLHKDGLHEHMHAYYTRAQS